MALEQQLLEDFKAAMKAGPAGARRKSTISLVRSAINYARIEKGATLTDDEILDLIRGQVKQRRDSIEAFAKGGRQDLVDAESEELAVLQSYLPQEMSEEDIAAVARDVIAQTGAKGPHDLGKVMPQMMRQLKDKADGRVINQVVRRLLDEAATS